MDEQTMVRLREDLSLLNARVHDLEKYAAVTNEKLGHISASVDGMSAALIRVLWVFGGSVVAATATWVINGGLITVVQ